MATEYKHNIETTPISYNSSLAPDILDGGCYLTYGTKNVLIGKDGSIESRKGKVRIGQQNDALNQPVIWSDTWLTSWGDELSMRVVSLLNGFRQWEVFDKWSQQWSSIMGNNSYLASSNSSIITGASWFDRIIGRDLYLLATGNSTGVMKWDGGVAHGNSQSGGTALYKSGTSWKLTGFSGDLSYRKFTYRGVTYTYTGGEDTNTLTGISPTLPNDFTYNDPIIAYPVSYWITIPLSITNFYSDIIAVRKNQLYLASSTRREVFISKQDNFADFGFSVPVRIAGEGAYTVLDQYVQAMSVDDMGNMTVSCGNSLYYDLSFKDVSVSTGNSTTVTSIAGEILVVDRAKIAEGAGVMNAHSLTNTKNGVMVLTKDKSVDYLSRLKVYNNSGKESLPISEPIRLELDRYNLDKAVLKYYKGAVFLLIPEENKLFMYDTIREMWQPPMTSTSKFLSVYDGDLLVHSNIKSESYRMFYDTQDNGTPIAYEIVFGYKNGGVRDITKSVSSYFLEMKINEKCDKMSLEIEKGYKGTQGLETIEFGIDDGEQFLNRSPLYDAGIGDGIGSQIGSTLYTDDFDESFIKYKRVFPFYIAEEELYEVRARIKVDKADTRFKIVSQGFALLSAETHNDNLIKSNL